MKSGKDLANEGMQQSLLNADIDWRLRAEEVIRDMIHNSRTFTSDDVLIKLSKMGVRSVNNSALGAIIKRFAANDDIEPFAYQKSKRPERHGAPVRVWRSKVYKERYV